MSLDANPDARSYHRPGRQRLEDARVLLDAGRTNGAIFLAGFAIELLFKSVILANSTVRERPKLLDRLKGDFGHNLNRLRQELSRRGVHLGPAEAAAFRELTVWDNDVRYQATVQLPTVAAKLFRAAESLFRWAERRGGSGDAGGQA